MLSTDPKLNEWTADVDRRIWKAVHAAMSRGFVQAGDPVVVLTGWKPGSGATNTMRIITATDMRDKDLLPPITGISSIPSFAQIGGGEPEGLPSAASISSVDDVKFF